MILEQVNCPKDLKKLSLEELQVLSDEVRHLIVDTVSRNGGHLSSNLGVVELTIALHYVLNSPVDKIIWDVGHQCYAHKILTGRRDRFWTLRKYNGISGFPNTKESSHDAFNVGHASTSISAAFGMALSRDIKGEDFKIVSVIGDGALSGGLAFEALNHVGHLKRDIIVVLNSNEMSISRSVGALAGYINRLITAPFYNRLRTDIDELVSRLPRFGPKMISLVRRIKESIKHLIVPGALFSELGFRYFGPIDGHSLPVLVDTFKKVFELRGPLLVHVVTKKGKGYYPAEFKPELFHGTSPFDVKSGQPKRRESSKTFSDVFGEEITRCARKRSDVVAITAAMVSGTGLSRFASTFPDRFFDVGIAEAHAVTLAAGMASRGLKPIVAVYSTFLQRAYDQILHDVCLQGLPVIFMIDRAGIVGEDGPTHQGIFDIAYLRHLPNIILMAPMDGEELREMFSYALNLEQPVAIRYPKADADDFLPEGVTRSRISLGCADELVLGPDGVIFAVGTMTKEAIGAHKILKQFGIELSVVNIRFINPLDKDRILDFAERTKVVFTIEEGVLAGGFGGGVLEAIEEFMASGVIRIIKRFGLPKRFIEQGSREFLLEKYGLSSEAIARQIRSSLGVGLREESQDEDMSICKS